jgi:hypothetical protein
VAFDVGGVIHGDIAIRHSYITIAGQTAPNPGITVEGRLLSRPRDGSRLHDIVVRFLRFRPLPTTGASGDRNAPAKPSDKWYLADLQHDESLADSDDDGMPDDWEEENGCDMTNDTDHNKVMPSGYTAIEEYINERAWQLVGWAE